MKKKQIQIVQLIETQAGIYGLDTNGVVWVYQGHRYGWSPLNMKPMTATELKSKFS
jgi:hypothetical protein